MLVVLSTGMLTALTGTGISQVAPVFAETEDCEDNDDDNCNERNKKNEQTNECPVVFDNSINTQGDFASNGDNQGGSIVSSISCSNFAANPDDVEKQAQVGQDQTLEPHDNPFQQLN